MAGAALGSLKYYDLRALKPSQSLVWRTNVDQFEFSEDFHSSGQHLLKGDVPARSTPARAGKASSGQPNQRINVCGLLSLQYYQPFFDVDTSQVKTRLFQAAWPIRKSSSSFLGEGDTAAPTVDLYGPVWVSAEQLGDRLEITIGSSSIPSHFVL